MPVGHVLIGDAGRHIEHDDTALPLDVVSITEPTKLLLPSRVPHVKANGTKVGAEGDGVDLDTEGSCRNWRLSMIEKLEKDTNAPMYFFSNSPVK